MDEEGKEHVIGYYSCKLSDIEARYSVSERECLAVVQAVRHFRVYLEGNHFDLYTDCSALQYLFNTKDEKHRLFRRSLELSTYDYTSHHRPGTVNQAADALSRNPVYFTREEDIDVADEIQSYNIHMPTNVVNGMTYVHIQGTDKLVVPPSLVQNVLTETYDGRGHRGKNRTKRLVATEYWWPSWTRDVQDCSHVSHLLSSETTESPNSRQATAY